MMLFIILFCVGLSVAGIIFSVATWASGNGDANRQRLLQLTGKARRKKEPGDSAVASLIRGDLSEKIHAIELALGRFWNIRAWLEQAGMARVSPSRFMAIVGGLAIGGLVIHLALIPIKALAPLTALVMGLMPIGYLWFMRGRRLKRIGVQLPAALDLIGQALRSGQSLPSGFQMVAQQTEEPLGPEFGRCFEEQNLGIPLEQCLKRMVERVPNMDLKFFVTSVVLQRQTGGDLAEVLDKIASLIRERLQIAGQIQALTGEGRLSGIVLLALPPALLLVMLRLNYDYIMMLFNDPLGRKMLAVGIATQILGAICIKKIITIKV